MDNKLLLLALAVIFLAIGAVITNEIIATATDLISTTQGNINASTSFTAANIPLDSVTSIINQTSGTFTSPGAWNATLSTGVFTFGTDMANRSVNGSQLFNISYVYQPANYMDNSINRLIAGYVPTFVLLALLTVAAIISIRYFRKED